MKILVLNAGSGSQKCSLFEIGDALPADPPEPGQPPGQLFVRAQFRGKEETRRTIPDDHPRHERIAALLWTTWEGERRVLGGPGKTTP